MGLAAKTTTAARGDIRARFDGMPATLDGAYLIGLGEADLFIFLRSFFTFFTWSSQD